MRVWHQKCRNASQTGILTQHLYRRRRIAKRVTRISRNPSCGIWCPLSDSNRPPHDYKSSALPNELRGESCCAICLTPGQWQLHVLVPMGRIELPTTPLPRECSATEPHGHLHASPDTGAGDEARTRDLNLGKVALYQLSYSRVCGSPTWARTRDLRINSPALYQLSYRGIDPGNGAGLYSISYAYGIEAGRFSCIKPAVRQ